MACALAVCVSMISDTVSVRTTSIAVVLFSVESDRDFWSAERRAMMMRKLYKYFIHFCSLSSPKAGGAWSMPLKARASSSSTLYGSLATASV